MSTNEKFLANKNKFEARHLKHEIRNKFKMVKKGAHMSYTAGLDFSKLLISRLLHLYKYKTQTPPKGGRFHL